MVVIYALQSTNVFENKGFSTKNSFKSPILNCIIISELKLLVGGQNYIIQSYLKWHVTENGVFVFKSSMQEALEECNCLGF